MADSLTHVTIINFTKYNARKDVTHSTWFRFEHSIFEKPEFFEFTHAEKMAWIYLLCQASKKNSDSFTLSWAHIEKIGGFKKREFEAALEKLQQIQAIHVDVTDAVRARDVHVTATSATDRQTDITRQDRQDKTDNSCDLTSQDLLNIFVSECKSLPKPEKMTKKRETSSNQRIQEKPDPSYWIGIAKRIEASDFCKGLTDSSQWVADYDWFIKPDTHIKVMEGKYDTKKRKTLAKGHFQRTESADQEFQEIMNEVVNQ